MKSLIAAIIGLTIATAASPGTAYVAAVVTSIPVTNSADDDKRLEAALEAAIKDSKRFKDEPGYWAYFSFGHKYPLKAEVAKGAVASCNQCHADNAGKTDWVFSQYYPVLRAAAPKSK